MIERNLQEAIEEFEHGDSGVGGSGDCLNQIGAIASRGDIEAEKYLCKVLLSSNTTDQLKTAYAYLTEEVEQPSMETRELLCDFEKNPGNTHLIAEVKKDVAKKKAEKNFISCLQRILGCAAFICALNKYLAKQKTATV